MNEMYFSKKDVEKGLANEFVNYLLTLGNQLEGRYCDVHVFNEDCETIAVQWVVRYWNDPSMEGGFKLVHEDEIIMKEYRFPDGHYEYLLDDEEYQEKLKEYKEKEKN